MNKKKMVLIIALIFVMVATLIGVKLISASRNHQGDIEITHELGITAVKTNPEKVVVFDLGILETLDALDIKVAAVPKSSLPTHLSKYKNEDIVDAGTLFEPNFEKLYELAPDLIIISARQASVYDKLDDIAPTIYLQINNTDFINGFKENLEVLSLIFTKQNNFKEFIEEVEKDIEKLHETASQSDLKGLFIMVDVDTISVYGKGSRFDVVYNDFGVKVVDENIEASTHGQTINFEYLLEKNPDIIFVLDKGFVTEGKGTAFELLNNEIVNKTSAAKNGKIIYLTPYSWYITTGGLDSIKTMISEVASAYSN
jgi:iron complex transport system substrate-binding protein